MKSKYSQYAQIDSIKKNDDGTIVVSGFASTGASDSDGETVTPEAMQAAIPSYMKFGAVREMHGKNAAGTALDVLVQDDGKTAFSALVVDPTAILKVESGVYKGFSIGANVTSRDPVNNSIITGINLIEVSLVDRPANPEALITMFKAETPADPAINPVVVAPVVDPVVESDTIKKGMWSVQDFASVLSSVSYLVQESAWEAEYEGDNSPIPAALRDWFTQGAAIFQSMVAEEVSELAATLSALVVEPPVVEVIEMAATATLQKAGAKFSAETSAMIGDLHQIAKDLVSGFEGLGYPLGGTTEPEPVQEEAEKFASVELAKAAANRDDINKAFDIAKAELIEKSAQLEKAHADIAQLKALPMPPKAGLFSLQAPISKAQDIEGAGGAENPHKQGTVEYAEFIAKAILSGNKFG